MTEPTISLFSREPTIEQIKQLLTVEINERLA
jgi:hypothetical protein